MISAANGKHTGTPAALHSFRKSRLTLLTSLWASRHVPAPPPEPPRLPRYEDALPYDLIRRALRDADG